MSHPVQIRKEENENWGTLYHLESEELEVAVTADLGPRVIHLSRKGRRNILATFPADRIDPHPEEWQLYGGHRLWHAPEARPRTYIADNRPVTIDKGEDQITARQDVEAATGIEKALSISFTRSDQIRVSHRLANRGLWEIELAPWAITVLAPGGFAVTPLPTTSHPDRLLPNRTISLWPYTHPGDERYLYGENHILVRQQSAKDPAKIGVLNNLGWTAYYISPFLFVKRFTFFENASYPDFGSSVEIYTNSEMLELETLGPLVKLSPQETVTHEEYWEILEVGEVPFSEAGAIEVARLVSN
ncbi:MAG TPA: hypothetical protein VKZ59_00130 [Acidobacteriota bacterium]|nr:hypothetical protein [Acidobacteriota bacterium]